MQYSGERWPHSGEFMLPRCLLRAVRVSRVSLRASLGGRWSCSVGRGRGRRPALPGAQVVMALALLSGAGAGADDKPSPVGAPSLLRMGDHFIAPPAAGQDRSAWMEQLRRYRERVRRQLPGLELYDRVDLEWAADAYTCHFTFLYDRSVYDRELGRYTLAEFLDDGERAFGGYDVIVLWQGYPRLGVDERNQFDMYRDLPGGLTGLRELSRRAHERGVRVFVDYNPWDTGTRRGDTSDEEALADLVGAIEADGIFLDTLAAGSPTLRPRLDVERSGVVLASELHPEIAQLPILSMSWAQWLRDPAPPGLLHLKWIEPRHMQHQIRRWDRSHRGEIETAFFGGSGMLVWENVFGTYNPWSALDRATWIRAVRILRRFRSHFTSDSQDPFYPVSVPGLHAHRWPGESCTLFTLLNLGSPIARRTLFEHRSESGTVYFDLWNGRWLASERSGDVARVVGAVERLGCVLAIAEGELDSSLSVFLQEQRTLTERARADPDRALSVVEPKAVRRSNVAPSGSAWPGMVLVPAASLRMRIEHQRRECGCYPAPGTPEERRSEFLWGHPHDGRIVHEIGPVDVETFLIDEAEVTNAEFAKFLGDTGYRPRHAHKFLAHWPGGEMPPELADHPVVWIDLDDARAFARWAGKRLPTEAEWHLAAQGSDGRKWPWGSEFDPARCNMTGSATLPARSLPAGRSPYGCYHMSGNVWEWTESERDDGHTRFAMIRGGSYFNAEGSGWYVRGGPQPCDHHAKFLLLWPGLDRCSTVGFRCVKDVEQRREATESTSKPETSS